MIHWDLGPMDFGNNNIILYDIQWFTGLIMYSNVICIRIQGTGDPLNHWNIGIRHLGLITEYGKSSNY